MWAGLGSSASAAGRAVIVLGLFAAVGTAAGAIARGQLATTAITAGSMLLALLVAGIASIGQLSPASFVQAWMNFDAAGYLPTNFWSRFISGGPQPGELPGCSASCSPALSRQPSPMAILRRRDGVTAGLAA
jgi:hypothetical protein